MENPKLQRSQPISTEYGELYVSLKAIKSILVGGSGYFL